VSASLKVQHQPTVFKRYRPDLRPTSEHREKWFDKPASDNFCPVTTDGGAKFRRGALRQQASLSDHRHPGAELFRFRQVVRGKEHRDALPVGERRQFFAQGGRRDGIEPRSR